MHFIITCDYNLARGRRRVASFNAISSYDKRQMRGGGRWVVLGLTTSAANRCSPFTFLCCALKPRSFLLYLGEGVVLPKVEQEVTVAAVATACRTGTPHELDRFSPPSLPLPSLFSLIPFRYFSVIFPLRGFYLSYPRDTRLADSSVIPTDHTAAPRCRSARLLTTGAITGHRRVVQSNRSHEPRPLQGAVSL